MRVPACLSSDLYGKMNKKRRRVNSSTEFACPDTRRVARRALILAAVVCRGAIEHGAGEAEAERLHTGIKEWLEELGLEPECEPTDLEILHTPLGGLTNGQVIDATWQAEGLAVSLRKSTESATAYGSVSTS